MSHELTQRTNGFVEMGFRKGTVRWHGLGNELPDDIQSDENFELAVKAAGMDWKVQRSKIRYCVDDKGTMLTWDDQHTLFRSDNKKPLGLVSDGFKIVQPRECLTFIRDLCTTNNFVLRTAGTLFEGRRFWGLADIGEESVILDPKDKVKGRVLIVTACDGSMKTTVKFVNECVVCNNTLTSARAESGKQVAVSHRSVWNPEDAKQTLGIANGTFAEFIRQSREFAKRRIGDMNAANLTLKLIGGDDISVADTKADEIRESRTYKKIMGLFNGQAMGSNLAGRTGTAWAWLNAVTEYADHHAPARNDDNRFNSSQFGIGDKMKNSALELLAA